MTKERQLSVSYLYLKQHWQFLFSILPYHSLWDDVFSESRLELGECIGDILIVYMNLVRNIEEWELLGGKWGESHECNPSSSIYHSLWICLFEEVFQRFEHSRSINIYFSHIKWAIRIRELLGPEYYPDDPRSLLLSEHRLIGSFEVGEYRIPECSHALGHATIKRSTTNYTLPLFLCIMRSPRINPMELEPENTPISSEEFTHSHSFHFVEIIDGLYSWSESRTVSFCDIWDLCYGKGLEYLFNLRCIEFYEGSERFSQISEHLCSDTSIRNTDRNRYPYISVDLILDRFCEFLIVLCHSRDLNKKFINREDFHLSESSRKVCHEPLGYLPIPSMIRMF